jgi:transcriptional regulator with XRE-family HTH domain
MPAQGALGQQLRALRHARGYSLTEVSEKAGISASFLSFVETGKNDITIGRLVKLVDLYGVSVEELLQRRVGEEPPNRPRELVSSPAEGVRIYLLAPNTRRLMMPVITVFEPGARTVEPTVHEGEEFVYVLEGVIAVTLDSEETILNPGQSLFFDARKPHEYRNAGQGEARVLGVASPPTL